MLSDCRVLSLTMMLFCAACEKGKVQKICIPIDLVDGRRVCVGQGFDSLRGSGSISVSEEDGSYYEVLDGGHFNRINYDVKNDVVKEITLFAEDSRTLSLANIESILNICRKAYSDSMRVKEQELNGVREWTWIWKVSDQDFAWVYCSISTQRVRKIGLNRILFHLGGPGEWEGLRAWDPKMRLGPAIR